MIRWLLRKGKRFLLRHLGLDTLLQSSAHLLHQVHDLRARLDGQTQALHRVEASWTPTVQDVAAKSAELALALDLADAERARTVAAQVNQARAEIEQRLSALHEQLGHARALQAELTARQQAETHGARDAVREAVREAAGRSEEQLHALDARHAERAQSVVQSLGAQLEQVRAGVDARLAALEAGLGQIQAAHAQVVPALSELVTGARSAVDSAHGTLTALNTHVNSWGLDRWRIREYEGLIRYFRRKDYLETVQSGGLEVPSLETKHPIAVYSNDTKFPHGCRNDNSICLRFNRQLYTLLGERPRIRVLDLGCAGGGLVRSLLDDGHFAVGLEGSDYPLKNQAGEWPTIPHHLFTCDVTQPFRLTDARTGEPLQFDAITAWEVMEHIPEERLPGLFANLERHLAPGGYLLFSIAMFLEGDEHSGIMWHVTVKPREWWVQQFLQAGFVLEDLHPFDKGDWLRGSGNCRGDWHEDQGLGFHVVLRRRKKAMPDACLPAAA